MPTSAVTFEFTSPQFVFESGKVSFTKGGRLRTSEGEPREGELYDGVVTDVLVEGPIEFDAILGQLTVVSRNDRRRHEIAWHKVSGDITIEGLRTLRIVVPLTARVVLILRAEDSASRPVANARVSLSVPGSEATSEASTNERGEIVLLGAVGHYSAALAPVSDRRISSPVHVDFRVSAADAGERVVVLRIPKANEERKTKNE